MLPGDVLRIELQGKVSEPFRIIQIPALITNQMGSDCHLSQTQSKLITYRQLCCSYLLLITHSKHSEFRDKK